MGNKLNQDVEEEKSEPDKLDEELNTILGNHINTVFSDRTSMISFCYSLARGRFKLFGDSVKKLAKDLLGLYAKEGGDIDN